MNLNVDLFEEYSLMKWSRMNRIVSIPSLSPTRLLGFRINPQLFHPSLFPSTLSLSLSLRKSNFPPNPLISACFNSTYSWNPPLNQSWTDRLSLDTALSNKVNPSIGEVSLVMSMSASLGSGSHLDRCVTEGRGGDGESLSLNPSNIPLAGSIASVTTPTPGQIHGPDSHSNDGLSHGGLSHGGLSNDGLSNGALSLSSKKRHSFSSQSGSASCAVSLSERSTNIPCDDAASTRALAGSVCSRASNKSSNNSRFLRQLFN